MTGSMQRLQQLLAAKENEHLEFKEAKANFQFEKKVHSIGRTKAARGLVGKGPS